MTIPLAPELEAALRERARQEGIDPEAVAVEALRERFLAARKAIAPRDEWERRLLGAASDCGLSLPDSALARDE